MGLKEIFVVAACLALAQSIPMPFRLDIPADEVISSVVIKKLADADDDLNYRLPNNTRPIHYDIHLKTDIHNGQTQQPFSGVVAILIEVVEESYEITLHSRQQTIESIELLNADGVTPWLTSAMSSYKDDVEFLVITTTAALTVGLQLVVKITYSAFLRDDNMGFYKSSYKNAEDATVWIATTQFETTDARHAFPCYDEPQIRATFSIEIEHHDSYSAVSNWPALQPTIGVDNYIVTKFEKTEKVQTYLIAFVVSDFKSTDNTAVKKQRVFARPKSIEDGEGELALDAGQQLLDKFAEHLGVEYAPPKMDQFAIPDFDAGAMENWGLVSGAVTHCLSIYVHSFTGTCSFPIFR